MEGLSAPEIIETLGLVPHPRGMWMGARLARGGAYALLGCTVCPGFEFTDYEDGERVALTLAYPEFANEIKLLT